MPRPPSPAPSCSRLSSIVFGPEDDFFNRFAALARFTPVLPLIGGGETKFAPVFVGDIAEAVARLVDKGEPDGKTYELGGPESLSFKQLMQFTSTPLAVTVFWCRCPGPLPGCRP